MFQEGDIGKRKCPLISRLMFHQNLKRPAYSFFYKLEGFSYSGKYFT